MSRPGTSDHPFDVDTDVEPAEPGTFLAVLSDRWSNNTGRPNGGYVLAVAVRALLGAVAMPDPRVLAASYLRPAEVGSAIIETELVQAGRRVATAQCRLVQAGKECLRVIGQFGDLGQAWGPTLLATHAPVLSPPEQCVDAEAAAPIPLVTFTDNVEYRYPALPGWRTGSPAGTTTLQCWLRFKDHRPADTIGLSCLLDAGTAPVMDTGAPGSATIALSAYLWGEAPPGWLAYRAVTRHIIDGYHDEDVEIWDRDGRLLAQAHKFALIPTSV